MSQMASLIAILQLFVIICLLTYLQNRNIKASQTLMYSEYNTLPNNLSVCLSQDNVSTLLPVFERCLSVCLSVCRRKMCPLCCRCLSAVCLSVCHRTMCPLCCRCLSAVCLSVCRRTMCPLCCRCLSAVCLSVCLSV